jgi:hypothetical protein
MIDPEVLADFAQRLRREADKRHMTWQQLLELVIKNAENLPTLAERNLTRNRKL